MTAVHALLELVHANERGWEREAQRHRAIAGRIEQLLSELCRPLSGPDQGEGAR